MTVVSVETLEELKYTWLRRISCIFCLWSTSTHDNHYVKDSLLFYLEYKSYDNDAIRYGIQGLLPTEMELDLKTPRFLRGKSQTNRENDMIQGNLCKKLLRKTKRYFSTLDKNKMVISCFSFYIKGVKSEKIFLPKEEKVILIWDRTFSIISRPFS